MEVIAEIGQAHDGSLGLLYSYVDALAATGVHTVKFQIHIAEAESSQAEPFRVPFSYEDQTRFDYWKRMEFTEMQWKNVKAHCESNGLRFLASPFSIAAVDLLEKIGVERFKIGSGEVTNSLMLEKIARTGKPVILSSGMSSIEELNVAVSIIQKYHNEIAVMQCTTEYPTAPENIGFNVLAELRSSFPTFKVGLSEHTSRIETGLAALVLGADLLEFHAVFDKRMFGPDATSSLTIDEVTALMNGIDFLKKALDHPIEKNDLSPYSELKPIFEKSLAVNRDLKEGHVLTFEDLESKKPANMGIPANAYESVLGKRLKHNLKRHSFLQTSDLRNEEES